MTKQLAILYPEQPLPRRYRGGPRYVKSTKFTVEEWEIVEDLMRREGKIDYGEVSRRAFATLAEKHGLTWPE